MRTSGEADLARHYLTTVRLVLESQKRLAEGAMAQLDPEQFHWAPDSESNSVATIVKHVAGNMRSRWTDFLTTDGEKPDRRRDTEFVEDDANPTEILARWEAGWAVLFGALDGLEPEDLLSQVTIRGEAHTVVEALERQVAHYAHHVGQIVYLCKHQRGAAWRTLSIPRGQSETYRPGS